MANVVPEWYKNQPKIWEHPETPKLNGLPLTVKSCMPFLDALTTGYVLKLNSDVEVVQGDNGAEIVNAAPDGTDWDEMMNGLFSAKRLPPGPLGHGVETPIGYEPLKYEWWKFWGFEAPTGYSAIITHPFNHPELPFWSMTSVEDWDGLGLGGIHGVWIKKGFEGVIPKGTPYVQIIPFKRENWNLELDTSLRKKYDDQRVEQGKAGFGVNFYREQYWNRKTYR
jgi:hypothetical protein